MNAWETAVKTGLKYFYEAATETVRQAPENYLIFYRTGNGEWTASQKDAAVPLDRERLDAFLDLGWRYEPNGDALTRAFRTCEWILSTVNP